MGLWFECTVCCYGTNSEVNAEKHFFETDHDVEPVQDEDEDATWN